MKKSFLFVILSLLFSFTVFQLTAKETKAATIQQDANGNWFWGYNSQLKADYYSKLDGITDQSTFRSTLHTIIATGAKKLTYGTNSGNSGDCLRYLDEDPNNTNNVLCMYTGKSFAKTANGSSGTSTWNQEHTWAKSHGFSSSSYAAYSDINHLHITECQTNSYRSNSDFGEVSNPTKTDSYGNKWTSTTFEPRDCVKGDIARAMLYMDIRYEGDSSLDGGLQLTLVNKNTDGSSGTGYFGFLDTLLKWNKEDPVDDYERRRNDRAYEKQGNRNPFIDHPEYADIIFGPTDVNTGSQATTFTVSYSLPSNTTFDYKDTTIYTNGSLITEPNVIPSYNEPGYVFEGWYSTSNYGALWDFQKDTITKNTILYGKFTYVGLTKEENFQALSCKASLCFNYDSKEGSGIVSNTATISKFSGNLAGGGQPSTFDFSKYATYDTSLFDMQINLNDNANFYLNSSSFRLYAYKGNGTSLDITIKDSSARITDIKLTYDSKSNQSANITIASDGKSAKIQNTASATSGNYSSISSFTISYESGNAIEYSVEKASLRYVLEMDRALYDEFIANGNNVSFGFVAGQKNYQCQAVINEDTVSFAICITNIPYASFKTEISMYAYVMVNGTQILTNNNIHASVSSVANDYITKMADNPVVKEHLGVLTFLTK